MDLRVARLAQAHQVAGLVCAALRNRKNMMNFLDWCQPAFLEALLTQRGAAAYLSRIRFQALPYLRLTSGLRSYLLYLSRSSFSCSGQKRLSVSLGQLGYQKTGEIRNIARRRSLRAICFVHRPASGGGAGTHRLRQA